MTPNESPHRTVRLSSTVLWVALASAACGTFLAPDRCGLEARTTVISGDLRDPRGTLVGRVRVQLTETRGGPEPLVLQASFPGPSYANPGPLLGHVQKARLVRTSGEVLRAFAFTPGNEHQFILVSTEIVQDAAAFDVLRRDFIEGRVLIELATDLPGLEQLRVPLPLEYATGWGRSRCT